MIDKRIVEFITHQKTASISCLDENNHPYCFTVFFVFDESKGFIYFKSSSSSNHSKYLQRNKDVAGTILPDKLNLLAIRGIQFTGFIAEADSINFGASAYHKKNPFALAMPGDVWAIKLESIKMTDNTLGIGKKIIWNREEFESLV